MSNKDEIRIQFESSAKYLYEKCDVAYGRLYLNDMYLPALRLCIDTYMADLPLKVDGNSLQIVKKAPYYIQIPPYLYVTYTTAPDVLYLITKWEAKRLFCSADVSTCTKLPAVVYGPPYIERVYTTLKSALV
jgi:hypothetical protein